MSLMGQKTNPSRAKIQLCPLWSKSRQTRVRSVCSLSAICVLRCNAEKQGTYTASPTLCVITARLPDRASPRKSVMTMFKPSYLLSIEVFQFEYRNRPWRC
jgi:hypothetical protein